MPVDVETLRRLFAREPHVELALLFGSRARGTATPASDVDLAYIGHADPVGLSDRLTDALGADVHLVQLTTPGSRSSTQSFATASWCTRPSLEPRPRGGPARSCSSRSIGPGTAGCGTPGSPAWPARGSDLVVNTDLMPET